jgi:hypothetical protein
MLPAGYGGGNCQRSEPAPKNEHTKWPRRSLPRLPLARRRAGVSALFGRILYIDYQGVISKNNIQAACLNLFLKFLKILISQAIRFFNMSEDYSFCME